MQSHLRAAVPFQFNHPDPAPIALGLQRSATDRRIVRIRSPPPPYCGQLGSKSRWKATSRITRLISTKAIVSTL